ncbi:hypothetical protein ABZ476_21460 [Streptomyces albogriseolus]|uniref:hypothetical protein n=1 Tax=Streptomyces albogriseolus TaxID=1887 RepID=UPI003460BEF7
MTYADAAGRAHARRWTNRQSGHSAVRDGTRRVLVVAEAMHEGGADTVARTLDTLAEELAAHWPVTPVTALLAHDAPEFTLDDDARVP